jgi:hypothetical protein
MGAAMLFIDKIDAVGCGIVFLWPLHFADGEWVFNAKTLAGTTLLKTSIASKYRARVVALRNELIDDLCARDIEVVEVGRMMLRTVDGEVSIALH